MTSSEALLVTRSAPEVEKAVPCCLATTPFPQTQKLIWSALTWEALAYLGVCSAAFLLRMWDLGGRAMHHDESLHATFAWYLFKGQGYSYNPVMHGPLQFFVMALFYVLFGDSATTARLFAALCGSGLVILPIFLRQPMGKRGAFIGSIALAISPAFLYYSRFARDDIYLDFFSLLMVVSAYHYVRGKQSRYAYILAAAVGLATTTMEGAYIALFIFGTFLGLVALADWLVLDHEAGAIVFLKSVPGRDWINAIALFAGVVVLLYSSFFTNPYGLWDPRFGLLSPNRQDIFGGLMYWVSQHSVARGGQPWYYYLLLFPLYEQFAVVFGIGGAVWALVRRDLFTTFLLYWAVLALIIYSWAGEKMPWLFLHPLLPVLLLAATFAGRLLQCASSTWQRVLVTALALAFLLEVHSAQALAYADAANPTEMLIYVQTSNDVPMVASEASHLAVHIGKKFTKPLILVDDDDLQGWPFEWYFRNLPAGDVSYVDSFAGANAPMLIMLGPQHSLYNSSLEGRYLVSRYVWNWWFPEDYKGLTFDQGACGSAFRETPCPPGQKGTTFQVTGSKNVQAFSAINVWSSLASESTWQHLWNWFAYRTPFGHRGTRLLYFYVRKDLVHRGSSGQTQVSMPGHYAPVPFREVRRFGGAVGGAAVLQDPRGIAVTPNGAIDVADAGSHRVSVWSPKGQFIRTFGRTGRHPGEFNSSLSPMDVGIGTRDRVYVADWWGGRIEEFTAEGKRFLRSWGHPGNTGRYEFFGPRSLAIAPDGRIYVADTGNEQVAVFSPLGRFLFRFGMQGRKPGQFDEPSSVAVGHNNDVYVTDMWNRRIQRFTLSGRFLNQWHIAGWATDSYQEPYLAVLQDNTVAVTDPQNDRILLFGATGKSIGQIQDPNLITPTGLAAADRDRLVVSDPGGHQVAIIQLLGKGHLVGTPP